MKAFYSKHPNIVLLIMSFLMSSVIILLSCSLASFLYPTIAMQPYYNDPSTFVIMGKEMAAGKTPYIEIFDHKGLYIFYITVLYAFLGKFGIFLAMSIFMTMSLLFLLLTLKTLDYGKRTTACGLLFFATLYTFFAQFPGDADAIVMVGMMMFYFYIRGYKENNDKFFLVACLLAGVSAGIAMNIRPSDAMLGFAFMIFYIVKRIREKKIALMIRDSLLCLLALAISAIPAYIHALVGGFLNEMVDAVFLSNFKYMGSAADKSVALMWLSRFIVVGIFVSLFLLWFFKRKEYQLEESLFILIISGIIMVLQFVIALFAHYLISVSGFIALALVIVSNKYQLLKEERKSAKPITTVLVAIFAASLLFNPVLYLSQLWKDKADIAYVKDNISEEDRKEHTFLFSVYPGLYLNTGINVIYPDFNAQTYHMKLSKNFTEEHMANFIQSDECHYVVTRFSKYDDVIKLMGDDMTKWSKIDTKTWFPTTLIIFKHNL